MASNKSTLNVSELNFDDIKTSLKTYLRSQTEFSDYDFDSSTLSILLDVLAYNTYHNSFYLNMVGNEMFLDSAQLRNSVVSRAKMLNYVPRSARGATAALSAVITPDDSPTGVTVPANTQFTSTIDGIEYTFVTSGSTTMSPQDNGTFTGTLNIVEGTPLQHRFTVSTANPVRYILPNENTDTTSFTVRIQESSSNTTVSTYNLAGDLSSVNSTSKIYFVQENEDNLYEIQFGDSIFGKKPIDGNIIIVDYRITSGNTVNGVNTFSAPESLAGYSNFTITTTSSAQGGAPQETIDSIKFNAPFKFQAQDRLVTKQDYKNIILSEQGDIQSISVWGGEENIPAVYGKVFIATKPLSGAILSNQRKEAIRTSLKTRNTVSIDVEMVDATYLYINPTITVRYNPQTTSLTAGELNTIIQNSLISYESNNLGTFDQKFYLYKMIETIKDVNSSFVSVDADITIEKRFIPLTTKNTYQLVFNQAVYHPHEGHLNGLVSTSSFTIDGISGQKIDDNGYGILRSFTQTPTGKVYRNRNFGIIDYDTGLVTINNTLISAYDGEYLSVKVKPRNKNIFASRNQILLISGATISTVDDNTNNITSTVGTVATAGVSTTINTENAIATTSSGFTIAV